MRSKKALLNVFAGLSYEVVAAICGFVLPRLILSRFGSDYNGITSAIAQFLGYVSLLKAGIGGVTKAALYKPLSSGDTYRVSAIVNATNKFLKKVALIFVGSLIVFAAIYPVFVREDFDWLFTASLVVILGIDTFAQYYFGLTVQLLLYADQRQSVISIVQMITTVLNTIIAAILIWLGCSIHIVKLGSAVVFSLNPIIINMYARKKYMIDKSVPADNDALAERWDCFGLQVANFVNSNTDMLVLTIFSNVYEVSVYTVYYMVINGIRKLLYSLVNGIGSAFGNMFAKNEEKTIKRNLYLYEQITFSMSNFLFSVTGIMVLSFVNIYVDGITDVNYIRPAFAYILIAATLFSSYRIPYQSMVEVTGKFKETKMGGYFEAALNIIISVALCSRFGLIGVAVGTLCAAVFRTFQYARFMSMHIVERSMWPLIKRLLLSAVSIGFIIFLTGLLELTQPKGYFMWIIQSLIVAVIAGAVILMFEVVFYHSDLKLLFEKLMSVFKHKTQEKS